MDLAFLLILPAVLWVQSWHLLGSYSNPRTLGIVGAGIAIALLGIVLFQDNLGMAIVAPTGLLLAYSVVLSALVLLWAVYALLVAGVYLWGLDIRGLGFYSLFLGVATAIFAIYFFVGDRILDDGVVVEFSWLLGVVAILLAIMQALMFFYLAFIPRGQGEPSSSPMRTATGWVYLIFSSAIGILAALLLLGLNPVI